MFKETHLKWTVHSNEEDLQLEIHNIRGFMDGHRKEGQRNTILWFISAAPVDSSRLEKEFWTVQEQDLEVRWWEAATHVHSEEQDHQQRTERL